MDVESRGRLDTPPSGRGAGLRQLGQHGALSLSLCVPTSFSRQASQKTCRQGSTLGLWYSSRQKEHTSCLEIFLSISACGHRSRTRGQSAIIIIIDIHTRQGAIHEKEEREKEDSREAGSVDQCPAGLCPVANRGLKGSWTDHWPTHVQHRNRKCDIYN